MIPQAIVRRRERPLLDLAPRRMSLFWIFALVLGASGSILDREPTDEEELDSDGWIGPCGCSNYSPAGRCLDEPGERDTELPSPEASARLAYASRSSPPEPRSTPHDLKWLVADTAELITGKLRPRRVPGSSMID